MESNNNKIVDLKGFLVNYCNKRTKQHKTKDPFYDTYRQNYYIIGQVFETDFNAEAFSFAVTFPQKATLEEEWKHTKDFIVNFKIYVSKNFMVLGGVIAVEAHKNSTLKSSRGKNTKAGRPHIHMILWFAHQFLNPSMHKLKLTLELQGTISRVKRLKEPTDVFKAGLYVTKDRDDKDLRAVVQKYLKQYKCLGKSKGDGKYFSLDSRQNRPCFCFKGVLYVVSYN